MEAGDIGGFPEITLTPERRSELLAGGVLMPGCTVHHRESGKAIVIDFQGFLDRKTASTFHEFFTALLGEGHTLLAINFDRLEYIGSAGIHLLIGAVRRFRKEGGDVRMFKVPKKARQVFELVGLDSLMKMYATEEEAVSALTD